MSILANPLITVLPVDGSVIGGGNHADLASLHNAFHISN